MTRTRAGMQKRMGTLTWLMVAGLVAGTPTSAAAQAYPTRPVRLIAASSAGSGVDMIARTIGQKLGEQLGQQVLVDNRAGAGGNLGAEIAAKAAPDGYTLFMVTSTFAINVNLYPKLNYDLQRDFAPVSLLLGNGSFVLVTHPSFPAKTVKELIALARANPGQINYASAGVGNSLHLAGELFKSRTRVDLVHVAYKGSGPALTALLGGEVPLMFASLPPAMPHIRTNRLRALAVTGAQRSPGAPGIPTMKEAGVHDYVVTSWYGLLAPAATPADIVNRLHAESVRVMQQPDIIKRFADDGLVAQGTTPTELATFLRTEVAKWAKVVREARVTID